MVDMMSVTIFLHCGYLILVNNEPKHIDIPPKTNKGRVNGNRRLYWHGTLVHKGTGDTVDILYYDKYFATSFKAQ